MPESVVSAALLRRVLSETERSVLSMVGGGEDNAAIDLRLKLAPGTAGEMLPGIRAKVESAARRYREEPSARVRLGDERTCACGESFTVTGLSQRSCPACRELERSSRSVEEAALDVAGVSSEEEDTIHVGAGDGGLRVREPPPLSPAPATTDFDAEPEEPAVPDDVAPDPASNGHAEGRMAEIVAAAGARRERIVVLLTERERSVKCLSVELGEPLEKVRGDLARLEEEQRAERAGRNEYDWPGAPAEGGRKGKASAVWRPWTGDGAPSETAAKAERERGHERAPAPSDDRRREYEDMLFRLAGEHPEESHLFDRIERILDGPAASGAEA